MICSTVSPSDLVELVVARGGREVDRLADPVEELLPPQRPVVHRARQPEAVVDQVALAGHVALVHPADLGHGHVGLVDHEQEVLGEVVEQAVGGAAAGAAVDVHRVVLDAGARADLPHHLDVVGRAHPQPLRLQQLALPLEGGELLLELGLDARDRPLHAVVPGDVVGRREDVELLVLGDHLAGHRMQRHHPLDLVAEELDADSRLLVDREDLEGVAAHPERATGERHVVAGVLDLDQAPEDRVAVVLVTDAQPQHAVDVLLRGAQAVDARHRRHHDHVASRQQRVGRGVPQPLDLLVDRGVLLDVGVGLGDVRLGLVVVVVGDEVLDRVVGEQHPQLVGELRRQRLVGLHHQDRPLHLLGHPCHRRGLAGARSAQQHDVLLAPVDPLHDLRDRGRLVAGGGVVGLHVERSHATLEIGHRTHDVQRTRRHRQCFLAWSRRSRSDRHETP